jgi:ABC-2 type transport system permease protein
MLSTSTYKPTFLEKLLGKNYKWWYVIKYNIQIASFGARGSLIKTVSTIINTIAILWVWNYSGNGSQVFTYLLIGRLFKALGENIFYGSFIPDIMSGKFINKLLFPTSIFEGYFFQMVGRRLIRNFYEFASVLVAVLITVFWFAKVEFTSITNLLVILLLFLPIAFFINHYIGFLVSVTAFFQKDARESYMLGETYSSIREVLIGSIIPLTLIPFKEVFWFLPTSFILHHPMQIYLGKYDTVQTIWVFIGGLTWCIILYFLAKIVFKLGLKRNESVGL